VLRGKQQQCPKTISAPTELSPKWSRPLPLLTPGNLKDFPQTSRPQVKKGVTKRYFKLRNGLRSITSNCLKKELLKKEEETL